MNEPLYSVRMRASSDGMHVSGAERIVRHSETGRTSSELVARAMSHERGRPDSVTVTVESLAGRDILTLAPLPVHSRECADVADARDAAVAELARSGVTVTAARASMDMITGLASGMSGAFVLDARTGAPVGPDLSRGIRARAVDYHEDFIPVITRELATRGLDRTHLMEALALATKVANAPAAVAELCISDDPSYITGYVASLENGYMRITPMKDSGDTSGGRAFFVDTGRFDADAYLTYMRRTPVLVGGKFTIDAG